MNDDPLPFESEESRAFNDAESLSFLGSPLEPFSYARQTAATALGLKYGVSLSPSDFHSHPNPQFDRVLKLQKEWALLTNKIKSQKDKRAYQRRHQEIKEELSKIGEQPPEIIVYNGMREDAAIVVFVCSLPDSEVRQVRRQTTTYEDKLMEWGQENGLGIDGPNVTEAIRVFAEIVAGLSASKSQPLIPDAKGGEHDPNG